MNILRGENVDKILSLVREVEVKSVVAGMANSLQDRGHHPFYLRNFGLHIDHQSKRLSQVVREAVVDATHLLLKGRFRGAASTLWTLKCRGATDVSATQVRVKNNVLAIYPDIGLVAKFARPVSIRDANAVHNEYLTLSEIAAFDGLQAPEPIAFQSEPTPTIWMEYVDHRKVGKEDTNSVARAIAETLLAWYDHHGVTTIAPSSYQPLTRHLGTGITSIVLKGWNEAEATKIYAVLGAIAESQAPLFLSRIHGDASTGNAMITPSGSLIINDWETSRLDIVGLDMLKLIRANPEVQDLYSRWRLSLAGTIAADTTEELALMRILNGLNLEYSWRYFTQVTALRHRQAQRHIVAQKRAIIEVCDSFESAT